MARSRRYELGVGLLLLGALVALAYMALQADAFRNWGPRVFVHAVFEDAAGLTPGAVVSVAGLQVGTVDRMELDHDRVVVRMGVDPEAKIRADAQARIRARSLLGEKYVELLPGSPDAALAQDGDQVQVKQEQVEIDELVARMAPLVEAIDPEQLAQVVDEVGRALEEDPERIGRMLDHADQVLSDAAEISAQLPELVEEGRTTLRAGRHAAWEVSARASESEAVVARADGVLEELEAISPELSDMIAEAQVAVGDAGELLAFLVEHQELLGEILENLSEIDRWELRRLLREEGVLLRFRAREVVPEDEAH